jgi:hypothetical protein
MSALHEMTYLEQAHSSAEPRPTSRGTWDTAQQPIPPESHLPAGLEDAFWQEIRTQVPADPGIRGLDDAYVIADRPNVAAFIARNRLRGLLLQAAGPLNLAFGPLSVKVLSLVTDDEGSQTLFCLILASADLETARQTLEVFDQVWWLSHCHEVAGILNFDFELV